ncbi:MAG TPA: hypothetical protein VGE50_12440 [Gammaproteobacteria bacterium]
MITATSILRSGLALGLIAISLAGCSSHNVYLDDATRSDLRNSPTIYMVHYVTPEPRVNPPRVHVAPYANVALHDTPSGADIQSHLKDFDPADEVAQRFAKTLDTSSGLHNIKQIHEAEPLPVVSDLKTYQNKFKDGYLMEIWIDNWSFNYIPMDWKTYGITLSARARLSHVEDGRIVWNTGHCSYGGSGNNYNDRIILDDLKTAEKKKTQAKIRQTVEHISDECSRELLRRYSRSK